VGRSASVTTAIEPDGSGTIRVGSGGVDGPRAVPQQAELLRPDPLSHLVSVDSLAVY
jgi:hypothetical protein